MKQLDKCVYEVPIITHGNICDVKNIHNAVIKAQKRIVNFVAEHNLAVSLEIPFLNAVRVYEKQINFIKALRKTEFLDASFKLPKTISAIVVNKTLMIISPKAYTKIYPIEGLEKDGYEKLISHEIAHELHIKILNGNEDHMGPKWFYEGFAIIAADQFKNATVSKERFWEIIKYEINTSYKEYSAVIRRLIHKFPLKVLVKKAHEKD
ncbi:MAG: hypothetical protein ACOCUD_03190, partial [Bacillota bacterium]